MSFQNDSRSRFVQQCVNQQRIPSGKQTKYGSSMKDILTWADPNQTQTRDYKQNRINMQHEEEFKRYQTKVQKSASKSMATEFQDDYRGFVYLPDERVYVPALPQGNLEYLEGPVYDKSPLNQITFDEKPCTDTEVEYNKIKNGSQYKNFYGKLKSDNKKELYATLYDNFKEIYPKKIAFKTQIPRKNLYHEENFDEYQQEIKADESEEQQQQLNQKLNALQQQLNEVQQLIKAVQKQISQKEQLKKKDNLNSLKNQLQSLLNQQELLIKEITLASNEQDNNNQLVYNQEEFNIQQSQNNQQQQQKESNRKPYSIIQNQSQLLNQSRKQNVITSSNVNKIHPLLRQKQINEQIVIHHHNNNNNDVGYPKQTRSLEQQISNIKVVNQDSKQNEQENEILSQLKSPLIPEPHPSLESEQISNSNLQFEQSHFQSSANNFKDFRDQQNNKQIKLDILNKKKEKQNLIVTKVTDQPEYDVVTFQKRADHYFDEMNPPQGYFHSLHECELNPQYYKNINKQWLKRVPYAGKKAMAQEDLFEILQHQPYGADPVY